MIRRLFSFARREAKTIIKFLTVGGASFVVYIAAYTLQSRILYPGAPDEARVIMNLAASCLSVLFNYTAHRFWTYGAKETTIQQVAWYVFVAGSVTFLQSFLFWVGHVLLGIFDYLVILMVGAICASYTFLMHRYFTFRASRSA